MQAFMLFVIFLTVAMLVAILVYRTGVGVVRTPSDMDYGFGPAIQGLLEHHRLGIFSNVLGRWIYACRMPLIPVFGALVSCISSRFLVFFLIKNLICWSAWIYALLRLRRRYSISDAWIVFAAALVILVPYNAHIASHAEFEEGYLVALLGLLFVLLLTACRTFDFACIGLLVAFVYLTKSSMALTCGVAVVWAAFTGWKSGHLRALLPTVGLALAVLSWGGYIFANTGVFAFGADESSWNGWNFYKGNNPQAVVLYPRVLLDILDEGNGLYPSTPMHDEWELSHAQFAMGRKFVHDHPDLALEMDWKKFYVVCCDVKEAPEKIPGHTRPMVFVSSLINHLSVAICLLWMAVRAWKRQLTSAEVLALLMMTAYIAPYMVGFIYMRHMVPIYCLVALVLAVQSADWRTAAMQQIKA